MRVVTDTTGIVLAGGRGERLGMDKAALELGGRTLLQRSVDTLAAVSGTIIISLRADQPAPEAAAPAGARIIFASDAHQGRGPLAGLHAAMRAVESSLYFAAACDMPFLNAELVRGMYSVAEEQNADAVIPRLADGRFHPLHAVYRRSCLPHIARVLDEARTNRIIGFFDNVKVHWIEEPALRATDPELLSFFNINTREDLERAERLIPESGKQ